MKTTIDAYRKAFQHVFKYPTDTTNGLIVADKEGIVIDCFPMFHLQATLMPLTQVALRFAMAICSEKGKNVVGVYCANQRLEDTEVSPHTQRLLELVSSLCGRNLLLWQFSNGSITSKPTKVAVECRAYCTGSLSESSELEFVDSKDFTPVSTQALLATLQEDVKKFSFKNLIDFQDHLEDPRSGIPG
eukprot:NODE_4739_length_767_cov_76.030641_g4393_i0.p1 GENE.NODE_4739_length_767_cov_76.030641_g4393_i0~~NODE_4739_length_767_cov_76.030641_g4393_i0.p1  ORF type:complete len:188 (+),score=21.60 NODE_4739_length_767_cov_76.030641_g4393_i0:55-618(+)